MSAAATVHARERRSGFRALTQLLVAVSVALPAFVLASPAWASTETPYSMTTNGAWRNSAGANQTAQAFTVGSQPLILTEVSVWIRNASENNSSSSAGTVSAELYTASAGVPTSTKVADLFTNVSVGSYGDGFISGTGLSISLAANSQYAVVVKGSAGSTMAWKYNGATPTSTVPGASFTYGQQSSNSGSSWSANGTNYFAMTVSASSTPVTTDDALPAPLIQQFGRPTSGSCVESQPSGLDWSGVGQGGWSESWAQWIHDGRGGEVCTRTLAYSRSLSRWVIE